MSHTRALHARDGGASATTRCSPGRMAARAGGGTPKVEHYLLVFLKFIASVVPTIEYDYTLSI